MSKQISFWAACNTGWIAASGKAAKVYGVEVVVHRAISTEGYPLDWYAVSHPEIGCRFPGADGAESESKALSNARFVAKRHGGPLWEESARRAAKGNQRRMKIGRKPLTPVKAT